MEITVLIEEGLDGCPEEGWLKRLTEEILTAQGSYSQAELSLYMVGQEKIRELNRQYRGIDAPTDVLSFAMLEPVGEKASSFVTPPDGLRHLGEVIISYPQAVIQAAEHRHSSQKEIAILIIHGVLHLLGYDHDEPEVERRMRARETETLHHIEGELP